MILHLTSLLENTKFKEDLGLSEDIYLLESRFSIDSTQIESVRESFDDEGNIEDGNCFIRTKSGGSQCIKLPYEEMILKLK